MKIKKQILNPKRTVVLAVIAVILVFSLSAGLYAKYSAEKKKNSGSITADNFAFTSDYLRAGETPVYTVYDNKVTFTVSNTDGLNVTSTNITYSISGGMSANGTLTGGTTSTKSHTLTFDGTNREVTVSATSSAPYDMTLSAKFVFSLTTETLYSISDRGHYILLDIYTGVSAPTITVAYPSSVAADSTDTLTASWSKGTTSGTLSTLEANSHYQLRFFKTSGIATAVTNQKLPSDNKITINVG